MSRIPALGVDAASPASARGLERIQQQFGQIPNLFKVLAHSSAALDFYHQQVNALADGVLDRRLREQIAVATAGVNGCEYCASAHTLFGKRAGVSEEEIARNLQSDSHETRTRVALQFVRTIVERHGEISDSELEELRSAGFSEAEIVEIVAHVGMNIFTNYFNKIARTDNDFPPVKLGRPRAS